MNKDEIANAINILNGRIKKTHEEVSRVDEKHRESAQEDIELKNTIEHLNSELLKRTKLVQQANEQINNILSTTQFFNPSLADNLYNMNGNALQTNSYMAVRQMLGIVNNNTPGVLHGINGINGGNGSNGINQNGSAVGLTNKDVSTAGWWLWTMILERIEYFAGNFKIECENQSLKKAVQSWLFNSCLSGSAVIEKVGDKFKCMCATNVQINDEGEVVSYDAYNSYFVINKMYSGNLKEDEGLHKNQKITDNVVWSQWRSNGYNIWYYVMQYLPKYCDLMYLFWNKARLNKTVVLQKKGNSSTANIEAQNFMNPYQNVVTVNTLGWMEDEGQTEEVKLENKYEIKDLSTGEQTEYAWTNAQTWLNWWDNEIGIRSAPFNTNTARSITDEIAPFTLKLFKIQQDFMNQLEDLIYQIKEKWGIEVKYEFLDNMMVQSTNPNTVASKGEGGNEQEQKYNNGDNNELK